MPLVGSSRISSRGSWTKGRRQLQTLLHAGRVRLDGPVAGLAQTDVVEHLVGALQGVGARHPAQLAGVGDELHPGNAGKEALVLGHKADRLADVEPPGAQIHAEHLARPRIDRDQAQQGADQGRLARPVRAEQADGAGRHGHRELAQGRDLAVGLGDVVQRE